jgi:osmotically-inducible protein OsmY
VKNLFLLVISSVLVVSAVGCENAAKTSTGAPNTANETAATPDAKTAEQNQGDAQSDTRRNQLNADIQAREIRNNAMGGDMNRADGDLESEVRSKLEANLPSSQLAVDSKEGVVTISGTVANQQQLARVDTLAKEIKGVQNVVNKATVAPAQ